MMRTKPGRFAYDPMSEEMMVRGKSEDRFVYDPKSETMLVRGMQSPMAGHPPLPDTLWEASSPAEGDEEGYEIF